MRLKGQLFEVVSDIQGNCKHYSTALRKITSVVLFECGENDIATLKEMVAKIKLSHHLFFDPVWELSSIPLIMRLLPQGYSFDGF
jgi:hypothetical protein